MHSSRKSSTWKGNKRYTQTLSAPYGGTSPRVGGIAKAVLYDTMKNECQTLTLQDQTSYTILITKKICNCFFINETI